MRIHDFFLSKGVDDTIAIKSPTGNLTYQELALKSLRYSKQMLHAGITEGERIILWMENSPEAIALICACSRIGATFVAVSPSQPIDRLKKIIEKTQPVAIIHQIIDNFDWILPIPIIGMISDFHLVLEGFVEGSRNYANPPAYIVFTSGTTGFPKGITMSHQASISFFQALINHCDLSKDDVIGSISPLQFDFSYLDMGLAFGSGSSLCIIPKGYAYQPVKLIDYLEVNQVTQMNSVPTLWSMLLQFGKSHISKMHLHSILYAGERFAKADLCILRELLPHLRMINCFGHSESIACSFSDLPNNFTPSQDVTFGSGYPAAKLRLADENGSTIERAHQTGELYLSCPSMFDGYWDEPELTAKVLKSDPINPELEEFKSGDLCYRDELGNYYFVGRCDDQVKINGNRVELDDIASVVQEHPKIRQAIVTCTKKDNQVSELNLFVLAEDNENNIDISAEKLRCYCRTSLPEYMVPKKIIFVREFQVNENGKIDRHKLNNLISK